MANRGGYLKGREDKMGDISNTQFFRAVQEEKKLEASQVLEQVYTALTEKGYNPINQIVGYIMSGDPTYITSHKSARSLIMKVERDEILEELVKVYIETKLQERVDAARQLKSGRVKTAGDNSPISDGLPACFVMEKIEYENYGA